MFDAVNKHVRNCDILVMCAAVADYKPAKVSKSKIKKRGENISLDLVPTRDILQSLPRDRQYLVVGFAAETENVEKNANKKLHEKHCDIVVANNALIGMEGDENEVAILFRDGETKRISRASKKIISRDLVETFENYFEKRLTKKTQ